MKVYSTLLWNRGGCSPFNKSERGSRYYVVALYDRNLIGVENACYIGRIDYNRVAGFTDGLNGFFTALTLLVQCIQNRTVIGRHFDWGYL